MLFLISPASWQRLCVEAIILGHLAEVVVEAFLITAFFLNFGGIVDMLIAGLGSKTAIKKE